MAMPLYQARGAGTGGRQAGAQDFGGGEGKLGIAEGLSNLNEVGARVTDAEYTARSMRSVAQAAQDLEEEAARIDADPGIEPEGYASEYERRLLEVREKHGADLPAQYRDVYDQRLGLYSDRTRLGLIASGHKKQIARGIADSDFFLKFLADEEARAKTPEEAASFRDSAGRFIAQGESRGLFDRGDAYKRLEAYNEGVWGAALANGLADNPTRTRLELELAQGPYAPGRISEEDRAKAIFAAERAEQALVAHKEIEQRFLDVEARRVDSEKARAAASWALNKAVSADPNERLTPEDLALVLPSIQDKPALVAQLGRVVEQGGRFPPGPPDEAYYGRLQELRANDPKAYAELEIGPNETAGTVTRLDPELLGTRFEAEVQAQRTVREKGPDAVGSNEWEAGNRWARISGFLSQSPWYRFDLDELSDRELNQAQGAYYTAIKVKQADYFEAHGKNATGLEYTKLIDAVVFDLIEKYHDERLLEAVELGDEGVPRGTEATAGDPLDGISGSDVERIRQSLQNRGFKGTPEEIRDLYDQAVEAGTIQP